MATEVEQAQSPPARPQRGRLMQIVIVAALMVGEGVAVFIVANAMSGNPAAAPALEPSTGTETGQAGEEVASSELELAECRTANLSSGKLLSFHVTISGLVDAKDQERVGARVEAMKSRILDRVNFVFRSAEPLHFTEPDLTTIKRRLKQEFDRLLGDETLIKEILIPDLTQSR